METLPASPWTHAPRTLHERVSCPVCQAPVRVLVDGDSITLCPQCDTKIATRAGSDGHLPTTRALGHTPEGHTR